MTYDEIRAWATARGLAFNSYAGDQREPESGIVIREGGAFHRRAELRATSLDGREAAALYMTNLLQALGVNLDA